MSEQQLREEVVELRAVLRDIILGAEMMLQPPLNPTTALAAYAREVKRVAKAAVARPEPQL